MAALTRTDVKMRMPVGDRFMSTFRATIANANAADEWVVTGLSNIDAIIGANLIGQAVTANECVFRKNARGTGVAEGTNPGDLAIEGPAGTWELTVLGKA